MSHLAKTHWPRPLVKMYLCINQEKPISQLGPFEKLAFVHVNMITNITNIMGNNLVVVVM